MTTRTRTKEARLNFRLAQDLKDVIEQAALCTGQTVSDFAVATLVEAARKVIEQHSATQLSLRDRDRFLALLDDETARPSPALVDLFRKHKGSRRRESSPPRHRKTRPTA